MANNGSTKDEDCKAFVPVIDISMFDESTTAKTMSAVAEEVGRACTTSGFFFLRPTPKVQHLITGLMDTVRSFFALPLDEKESLNNDETTWYRIGDVKIPGTGPGYRGFGCDPNFKRDTRESYNFGDESVLHNKWPREGILPEDWKQNVNDYTDGLLCTSVILRRLVALALGQDMKVFDQPGYFDAQMWLAGMVHYSTDLSDPESGIHSIRPHCDHGIFTLLVTDGQPGLQICHDKTQPPEGRIWSDVPPAPRGHFTVNLGKNLERLSNGIFTATMHRVVNTTGKERYSSPFFYDTNIDTVLQPFPQCCVDLPVRYTPTTPAELSLQRLEATNEQFD